MSPRTTSKYCLSLRPVKSGLARSPLQYSKRLSRRLKCVVSIVYASGQHYQKSVRPWAHKQGHWDQALTRRRPRCWYQCCLFEQTVNAKEGGSVCDETCKCFRISLSVSSISFAIVALYLSWAGINKNNYGVRWSNKAGYWLETFTNGTLPMIFANGLASNLSLKSLSAIVSPYDHISPSVRL